MLIKVVITTIPTYAMSVFTLPKSWCFEINAMIVEFWWGVSNEGKVIHRRRGDTLRNETSTSGLGFRELHIFNAALLEKMVYRALSD